MNTTEAELAKAIINSKELIPFNEQLKGFLTDLKVKWWILHDDVWNGTFPNTGSTEKDICQPFVTNILQPFTQLIISKFSVGIPGNSSSYESDIELSSTVNNKAYKVVSFGSRKPDIVSYEKGCTGVSAITFFGDVKRSGTGDFSHQEMGHIIDMAYDFMEIQTDRSFLICFLTDGNRFQFFHTYRSGTQYLSQYSAVYSGLDGWQVIDNARIIHFIICFRPSRFWLGYFVPHCQTLALFLSRFETTQ